MKRENSSDHAAGGNAVGSSFVLAKGEVAWVKEIEEVLRNFCAHARHEDYEPRVRLRHRLPYTCEVLKYANSDDPETPKSQRYETDVLIDDVLKNKNGWIPRVIIECKLGAVTTHDALTYSTKASTHKHVHPYLRYGIILGAYPGALPGRLIRHGAYFDFMAAWQGRSPNKSEQDEMQQVLKSEIDASRLTHALLTEKRKVKRKYRLLHRKLVLINF